MIRRCRVWWPADISLYQPLSPLFLYGWCISCSSSSVDIVVAFVYDDNSNFCRQFELQGILGKINKNLPVLLQKKTSFSIVGNFEINATYDDSKLDSNPQRKSRGQFVQEIMSNSFWIELHHHYKGVVGTNIYWIPSFHSIYCQGQLISNCDFHVILYEVPEFCIHHFSARFNESDSQTRSPLKEPKWIRELHGKRSSTDMETVLIALNSAAPAKMIFKRCLNFGSKRSLTRLPFRFVFYSFACKILGCTISSCSTLLYVVFQYFYCFKGGYLFWVLVHAKVFRNTFKIIGVRCHEILYWPVFLQNQHFRLRACVGHREKGTSEKNSMWLHIVVDVIMGNLISLPLILHAETCVLCFSTVTNSVLRSGCVWLMGAPAGFKLNTELAGVFGFISLQIIQSWSTLCFFVDFLFVYFVRGIAVFGIFFGLTFSASAITDMIFIASSHILLLRWLISHVYMYQIEAFLSLWYMFRGKKWNPICGRYEGYDYKVGQHVVGSLLFTPVLLLLPTTSVFYIFFTVLYTCAILFNVMAEVVISVVFTTPYVDILLWITGRRRFSSGIWFEVLPKSGANTCVLFLHTIPLNIGKVVLPHYRKVFTEVFSHTSAASMAFGVLTGKRAPSTLGLIPSSKLPWMWIPPRLYFRLCYDSILGNFTCEVK